MKRSILGALALLIALLLAACAAAPTPQTPAPQPSAPEETAPEAAAAGEPEEAAQAEAAQQTVPLMNRFETVDLAGEAVTQEIFSDYKLTMVNIWATYCGYCIDEMPALGELAAEYADAGVQILGLVTDVQDREGAVVESQRALAQEIVEETGAAYPHILPSQEWNEAVLAYVSGIPATLLLDSEGNLVDGLYMGARDKEGWRAIIEQNLAQVA